MKTKNVWRKRLTSVLCLSIGLCMVFMTAACSNVEHGKETYIYLVRHGRTYSNERQGPMIPQSILWKGPKNRI